MSTTTHTHASAHAHRPWLAGLDRYAIGLSGLCMVHCLATSVLLALMSTAGGVLLDPIFHEVGLTIAIMLGAVALGRGVLHHGHALPAAMGAFGLGIMGGAMTLPLFSMSESSEPCCQMPKASRSFRRTSIVLG